MSSTPHRRKTDRWSSRAVKYSFIALTIIFVGVLIAFSVVVLKVSHNSGNIRTLVAQNAIRIKDIQHSRVESCERTYEGIRQVFKPFFPQHPTNKRQIEQLELFNNTIDKYKRQCVHQTDPNKTKPLPKGVKNQ